MSFANLSVRARLASLLIFVNVLLLASAGYAWYAISRLNGQLDHTIKEHNDVEAAHPARAPRAARLQDPGPGVEGHDHPRQRARRSTTSTGRRSTTGPPKVKTELAGPQRRRQGRSACPADIADKSIAEHEELNRRYQTAIRSFDGKNEASTDLVDQLVRGIDRAATDNIDARRGEDRGARRLARRQDCRDRRLRAPHAHHRPHVLALFAVVVSAVAGTLTVVSITRRLQRATEVAREVAAGNLTADIEPGRNDELGQLLGSLRDMNDSLTGIVGRVRQAPSS
jgi:methyl-accepting chemotaxis protein-1 (serine sensor receptor)